jgi:hypothetical protein
MLAWNPRLVPVFRIHFFLTLPLALGVNLHTVRVQSSIEIAIFIIKRGEFKTGQPEGMGKESSVIPGIAALQKPDTEMEYNKPVEHFNFPF